MKKPVYRITPRAFSDLKQVGHYTMKKWGKPQRNRYLLALEKRFKWLAQHPNSGTHRPDIMQGYYSYPEGSHVVFYMIHPDGIDIIGIPHQAMDILDYFGVE